MLTIANGIMAALCFGFGIRKLFTSEFVHAEAMFIIAALNGAIFYYTV